MALALITSYGYATTNRTRKSTSTSILQGNLYDNEWNFQNNVFEMLYKVNPKLANATVLQGTAIQKERINNDMAMRWLDADIREHNSISS